MALRSLTRRQLPWRITSYPTSLTAIYRNKTAVPAKPCAYQFSTISFDDIDPPFAPTVSDLASNRISDSTVRSSVNSPSFQQPQRQPHHKSVAAQHEIQNWINTNPKIAPYKAEEKLSQLWAEQMEGDVDAVSEVLVTVDIVNLVLQAWVNSNSGEKGAVRAERILRWMESLADVNSTDIKQSTYDTIYPTPNYKSYALAIEAWSKAASYESSAIGEEAVKFECARNCEDMLMHMQKVHELRLSAIDTNVDSTDSSWVQNAQDIQPDTNVFHHVLTAWSNIRGTKSTAIRATRILDLMQELHHYQSLNANTWQGINISKVQPNRSTYKIILKAWAHTGSVEGADRAELILRHLLSISKAGNVGVEIYPDEESFQIVMKAHADSVRKRHRGSGGAERAQRIVALLDWMELLASSRRGYKIRPGRETYRIAMQAWAWSHDVDAPKEAEGILFRMINASQFENVNAVDMILSEGTKPTKKNVCSSTNECDYPETRDFNTVINSCAFARGVGDMTTELDDDKAIIQLQQTRKEIFTIAENVFDSLMKSKHAQPDSDTFLGMIRACQSLLPNNEDRDAKVIELFRLAYQTSPLELQHTSHKPMTTYSERLQAPKGGGCVNANVLRQLRLALPSTDDYIGIREEFEAYRRQNVEV